MTASRLAEDFGQDQIPVAKVIRAKGLMRHGYDLHAAAHLLGLRSRDLDLALWDGLCRYGRRADV